MKQWVVAEDEENIRLLSFLKKREDGPFSSEDIRWALEHNRCYVNDTVERWGSRKVKAKEKIIFFSEKRPYFVFENERVLFEDDHLLIYNKPCGIASCELADIAKAHLVHRLDKETSGAFLLAKTRKTQELLENAFRQRQMKKHYLALVLGAPKQEGGTISTPMKMLSRREGAVVWGIAKQGGISAETKWKCQKRGAHFSLISCTPITGRTHQVRVHLSSIGLPIAGDVTYGIKKRHPKQTFFRTLLHADSLSFLHPIHRSPLHFHASLPHDFNDALLHL